MYGLLEDLKADTLPTLESMFAKYSALVPQEVTNVYMAVMKKRGPPKGKTPEKSPQKPEWCYYGADPMIEWMYPQFEN